jgi:aryl-alcohol dehydrogenase-like predicted oxidoreductase
METNVLGNSDLLITPVGFGAWAIGGDWEFGWGAQDNVLTPWPKPTGARGTINLKNRSSPKT